MNDMPSVSQKVEIRGRALYATLAFYADHKPRMLMNLKYPHNKDIQSQLSGIARLVTRHFKHKVDYKEVASDLLYVVDDTGGMTTNKDIPSCSSIQDYLGKWVISTAEQYKASKKEAKDVEGK